MLPRRHERRPVSDGTKRGRHIKISLGRVGIPRRNDDPAAPALDRPHTTYPALDRPHTTCPRDQSLWPLSARARGHGRRGCIRHAAHALAALSQEQTQVEGEREREKHALLIIYSAGLLMIAARPLAGPVNRGPGGLAK